MSNISKHTNIFLDGEVLGYNPDANGDFYKITDYGRDFNYSQEKMAFAVRALMGQADKSFVILYGGEVTDSGSGQVDISEGLAIGQDSDGNCRFVPIPALTNIPMPAGWDDGRQIWVVGEHLFKISTDTRDHKQTTTSYHYTVEDSYLGETSSDDLFVDSDPGATTVIWDSFTMTGTTFASLRGAERSEGNLSLNQKLNIGYNTSGQAILMNTQNTDLVIGTNNTARIYVKNDGKVGIGVSAPATTFEIGGGSNTELMRIGTAGFSVKGLQISNYAVSGVNQVGYDFNTPGASGQGEISFSVLGTKSVYVKSTGFVITNTTECTGAGTGALQVSGGADFAKHIRAGLGRIPVGILFGTYSGDQIFNALAPCVPNTNDIIRVSGGCNGFGDGFTFFMAASHIMRYSSTIIRLYGIESYTLSERSVDFIDGAGTTCRISLSW